MRGALTKSVRYATAADGTRQAYKWQATGFNLRDQIAGEQYVIPSNETGLGGTYSYSHAYSAYDGSPTSITYPAGGGLTIESVTTKYDTTTGLPTALNTNLTKVGSYVIGQQYTGYGEPTVTTMQTTGGSYVERNVSYELDTRRVHEVQVNPESSAGTVADDTYQYDASGQVLSDSDHPQVGADDNQCFVYDQLRRLISAWTPKTSVDCGTSPTVANLAGPAPYWTDWSVDALGNRTSEVSHTSAGDTRRSYAVPQGGLNVVRPHAVTGMTTVTPEQSSTTVGYTYDNAGNMISRPGPSGETQALTWDAEGHVAKIVEGGKTTTNVYDVDGGRLVSRDGTGSTLYLPGMEIHRSVSGTTSTVAGTRYYTFNGGTVASRTIAGLTWLFGDLEGTPQIAVTENGQQVSIRRQTPYGDPRGTNPSWPNSKGFVGGDVDATGLIHLGAREYDPDLGRFISVDPVQDLTDPQQWNAYSYCGNNPVSQSDPSGTRGDDLYFGPVGAALIERNAQQTYNAMRLNYGGMPSPSHNGGGGGGSSSGSTAHAASSNGGGTHNAGHPKKKHWWERAADWVSENQNMLAGAVAGIGTFLVCDALTGGVGSIGCMALAGAAASVTTNALDGNIHSASDLVGAAATGAIGGLLAVPLAAVDLANQAQAVADNAKDGDTAGAIGHGALAALDIVTIVDGVKGPGCKNSFAPVTVVLMASGHHEQIKNVKVGDKVVATDPDTGKTTTQTVEALHDNLDADLVDLTVKAGGISTTVHTTAHHPFWDKTTRTWTNAGDLKAGDELYTEAKAKVVVASVSSHAGTSHMLNLTVADLHTYYVLVGNTPVLVHNCGEASDELLDMADANLNGTTNVAAEVVGTDGGVGWGVSGPRAASQLTPKVRVAAQAVDHHMGCAEIGALCMLELGGHPIQGARGQAVKVHGGGNWPLEQHGEGIGFCPACVRLFDHLDGGPM